MDTSNKIIRFNIVLIVLFLINTFRLAAQEVAAIPPQRITVLQYIIEDDRPILVNMLTSAGLVPLLSGDEAYTFLAPSEEALKKLQKESPEKLKKVLSDHILKGTYLEKDLKDGSQVQAISGAHLTICRKRGTLLNGVRVQVPDKQVRNGVVHELSDIVSF